MTGQARDVPDVIAQCKKRATFQGHTYFFLFCHLVKVNLSQMTIFF